MLSFAVALLSTTALALFDSPVRGKNDGSDQQNALYTSFVNSDSCANGYVKLDMWTYIDKDNVAGGPYEFHGDTVAFLEGPVGQFMQYGMCIYIE